MKIGSLNVRGLGSDAKKVEVANFSSLNSLDFCCLQETKMESFSEKDGRRIWKKGVQWSVENAVGRSGGIITCWDDRKFVCTSSWSLGGAVIVNGWWRETREELCIINVYIPCDRVAKRRIWDSLGLVVAQAAGANVCIIGDFNSILDDGERNGSGWRVSSREMLEFKNFIESNGLIDVSLQGRKYTWYKPDGTCKSRIDRALINDKWAGKWNETGLRGLPRTVSDHCAILLSTIPVDWGPKPFRFINAWLSHPRFKEVVVESWSEGGISGWGSYVFKEKLKRLKEALKLWNLTQFGNMDLEIKKLKEEIQLLDYKDDEVGLTEEEAARRRDASANLIIHLNNKRSLLAQKARLRWLIEGDANSKIFHRAINQRRISNGLFGLEINDEWTEDPPKVKAAVKNYFSNLFSKKGPSLLELPDDLVESRLDVTDREELTRPFLEEEIKQVIWNSEGVKSPGPDGFGMEFYRSCWDIIKADLLRVFSDFHANGKLVKGCNTSYIVLIPKKEGVSLLNHFRPISLICSLYKILAKVLANRLQKVVGKVISNTQAAFIKDRFILDGVVVLNETIEDARRSKEKRIFFKVDFEKAFDSVSWDYLLDLIQKMNFPDQWVLWIKECISSAKANVLVNGSPSGEFALERGIRQGDPLSPFLFLIASEGLSLLMKRAVERGLVKAAEIGRDKISISHIQYADDTMFIIDGQRDNAEAIKRLLNNFQLVSGLSVNYEKSWVYGVNLGREELEELADGLGCRIGTMPIPYLGLKVGGRQLGTDGWGDVVEKVKARLRKWDVKSLSMGGRITIIKSILSALPIYGMSVLHLPKKVSTTLRSLYSNFLWGGSFGTRKTAWIK